MNWETVAVLTVAILVHSFCAGIAAVLAYRDALDDLVLTRDDPTTRMIVLGASGFAACVWPVVLAIAFIEVIYQRSKRSKAMKKARRG